MLNGWRSAVCSCNHWLRAVPSRISLWIKKLETLVQTFLQLSWGSVPDLLVQGFVDTAPSETTTTRRFLDQQCWTCFLFPKSQRCFQVENRTFHDFPYASFCYWIFMASLPSFIQPLWKLGQRQHQKRVRIFIARSADGANPSSMLIHATCARGDPMVAVRHHGITMAGPQMRSNTKLY